MNSSINQVSVFKSWTLNRSINFVTLSEKKLWPKNWFSGNRALYNIVDTHYRQALLYPILPIALQYLNINQITRHKYTYICAFSLLLWRGKWRGRSGRWRWRGRSGRWRGSCLWVTLMFNTEKYILI